MIVNNTIRNKSVVHNIGVILISVIILEIGISLPFQDKQQDEVYAQMVSPMCNPASPLIKLGSTGAKVVELQTFLMQLGYGSLLGQDGTKGNFAASTENAVKKFQQDTGLQPVDGAVGQKTWNAICSAISNRQQQQAVQGPFTQAPVQPGPEATIYRVTFHAITINENHDTRFGTGEWKLFALVNDKLRLLETCPFLSRSDPDENLDCDGDMYSVRDGQVVTFPSLYTDVKIGKGGAISVFVQGVDTDGEEWEPPTVPQDVQTALRIAAATSVAVSGMPINPITAIEFLSEAIVHGGTVMKWFASYDENDKLGKINEMYRGPNYQTFVNHPSDKGDYVLQYSIKALSPEDAYYSHAEDCKPPVVGLYCTTQQP